MTPRRRTPCSTLLAALLVPFLALLLSACGNGQPEATAADVPSVPEDADHNGADVAFATAMIPHHAQALRLVDLTRGRELSREVATLVEQIRATQTPEIERMTDWLVAWEQPVPATSRDHVHAGHDEEGGEGTASDELAALEQAPDRDFERLWLQAMIEHHEGAVELAQTEVEEGEHTEAVALADAIVTTQRAEIDRMQQLLG